MRLSNFSWLLTVCISSSDLTVHALCLFSTGAWLFSYSFVGPRVLVLLTELNAANVNDNFMALSGLIKLLRVK